MPKKKSNRAAKKRFRLTGAGRIRRYKAYASHILTKKSTKRKRNLRKADLIAPADQDRVKKMISA